MQQGSTQQWTAQDAVAGEGADRLGAAEAPRPTTHDEALLLGPGEGRLLTAVP